MKTLQITASTHEYEVVLGEGIRHRIPDMLEKDYQSILIITDDQVSDYYLEDVKQSFTSDRYVYTAVVPSGEASKSMECYEQLLDACTTHQLDRRSLIIALGGGMIGDLAGFTASTYLRGIDYIQVPTTILAHDSSVGGKVAINHHRGKNLIGSFFNPQKVVYDLETIATLSRKEIRSGYGEVIKHAFLSDVNWLDSLLDVSLDTLTSRQLEEDLYRGIQVKASIVEKDEKEADIRQYLNLGHTLAHAVESELGYGRVTHGEAVALGLLYALKLSSITSGKDLRVNDYVNWLRKNEYPLDLLRGLDAEKLVDRMKWDKKTIGRQINFVLLDGVGHPYVQAMDDSLLLNELKCVIEEVGNG